MRIRIDLGWWSDKGVVIRGILMILLVVVVEQVRVVAFQQITVLLIGQQRWGTLLVVKRRDTRWGRLLFDHKA